MASASADALEVPGSGSPETILRALAEAFNVLDAKQQVRIPPSARSVGGLRAIQHDEAVLARVSRRPSAEQGRGLRYLPFAKDAVVFVVGERVRVRNLGAAQVADIFSGKLTEWSSLGGAREPIRVIVRDEDETTLKVLRDGIEPFRRISFSPNAKVAYHSHEMVALLDRFGSSIGFLSLSSLKGAHTRLAPLALDGVKADAQSLLSGSYPHAIEYGLIFKPARLTATARSFIDFIFSEAGGRVLRSGGLLPLPREPA
jgi:phosphate transport system substrate-binding protein